MLESSCGSTPFPFLNISYFSTGSLMVLPKYCSGKGFVAYKNSNNRQDKKGPSKYSIDNPGLQNPGTYSTLGCSFKLSISYSLLHWHQCLSSFVLWLGIAIRIQWCHLNLGKQVGGWGKLQTGQGMEKNSLI